MRLRRCAGGARMRVFLSSGNQSIRSFNAHFRELANERKDRMIEFTVIGDPASQGSKRHVGGGRMIESCKRLRPWRDAVAWAALEAMGGKPLLMDGPLVAEIVFTLAKPKSAPKRRQSWPDKKPDIDKILRAVLDAMTTAGVYTDDARIVSLGRLDKVFPGEGEHSLPVPGVWIRVYELRP